MFVILTVTLLVLELCDALLARLLVLLSMGPLAVHAAVLDEAAGRTLSRRLPCHSTVGAGIISGTSGFSLAARHVERNDELLLGA